MGRWRVAIGCYGPWPAGVGADGRWQPPGLDGVDVLFVFPPPAEGADWGTVGKGATLAAALAAAGWDRIDCYVAEIAEYRPLPIDAREVADRVVLTVGDWNVAGQLLWSSLGLVDAVVCDHAGVDVVERIGHVAVPALLWGIPGDAWTFGDPHAERDIDVLFIGSANPAIHARRNAWLLRAGALSEQCNVVIRSRVFGPEYAQHLARAKIVFNHSVRGEANVRSYEGAVAGACVVNERDNVELACVYAPDVDHATYDEHDLATVVAGLLADDERRIAIAEAGQRAVRSHTLEAHLVARLRALRTRLDAAPRAGAGAHDELTWARFVEDQWRLGSSPDARARAGDALRCANAPSEEVERAQVLAGAGAGTGEQQLAADAFDAGARLLWQLPPARRSADLWLAHADAAAALQRPDHIAGALGRAVTAPADTSQALLPYVTPAWTFWRTALERRLLAAPNLDAALAAAHEVATARARYELATRRVGTMPAGDVLSLLGPVDDDLVEARYVRGSLLVADGRAADALDDLRAVVEQTPLDPKARTALATALAAAGDTDGARAVLDDFVRALGGFPDMAAEREAARAARDGLRERESTAWAVVEPHDTAAVAAALRWRLDDGRADLLRIGCLAPDGGPALMRSVVAALAALGIDADALPETEVFGAVEPQVLRPTIALATCVLARPDNPAAWHARDLGVPRVDLA